MKYTALEIIGFAGVEKPKTKIGKVSCSIGGVVVNTPDHVINVQDASEIDVIVANELFTASLPEDGEPTKAVRAALKAKGERSTKDFKARKPEKFEEPEVEEED